MRSTAHFYLLVVRDEKRRWDIPIAERILIVVWPAGNHGAALFGNLRHARRPGSRKQGDFAKLLSSKRPEEDALFWFALFSYRVYTTLSFRLRGAVLCELFACACQMPDADAIVANENLRPRSMKPQGIAD